MRPALILAVLEREFLSTREGHHTPVMLWGPPGVGKSQMVAQVAKKYSVPVIDIRLSQMEPTDLRGIPFRGPHEPERGRRHRAAQGRAGRVGDPGDAAGRHASRRRGYFVSR